MRGVGLRENLLARGKDRGRQAVMDRMRGEQRDAGMAMDAIVPVKERAAECATVLQRAETFWEVWLIFERLELSF